MCITASHFARALVPLRPVLIHQAAVNRPCSLDDAEDVVAETVCRALTMLDRLDSDISAPCLYIWVKSILGIVILRYRREESVTVATAPIAAAYALAADPREVSPGERLWRASRALPASQRVLVEDWLDGYSQQDMARNHDLHRNTVANRLELAFEALRLPVPDADSLCYDLDTVPSHASIYSRQNSQARMWRGNHPPDRRL